jgi:hypothetical protein
MGDPFEDELMKLGEARLYRTESVPTLLEQPTDQSTD